jgi:hypothetical protein
VVMARVRARAGLCVACGSEEMQFLQSGGAEDQTQCKMCKQCDISWLIHHSLDLVLNPAVKTRGEV